MSNNNQYYFPLGNISFSTTTGAIRKKNPNNYVPAICPGILLHQFTIFIISSRALLKIESNPTISCTGRNLLRPRFLRSEALHSVTPYFSISAEANWDTLDRKCKDQRNIMQSHGHLPTMEVKRVCLGT